MSRGKDYKTCAIVLKWVKLRETDVVVKMVDMQGALVEGVARGARKPKNSNSTRLEPLNCAEVFMTQGRGMDIIRESRILQSNDSLRDDPCKFSCASCLTELYCKTLQVDIEVTNLFGLTRAFLGQLSDCPSNKHLSLTAAALLKASSYLGFMPSFNRCIVCDAAVPLPGQTAFSYKEGGAICEECKGTVSSKNISPKTISCANDLLHSTLEQVIASEYDDSIGANVLGLACTFIKAQTGINLKSYPLALQICSC